MYKNTWPLNCIYCIIDRVVRDSSSLITLNKQIYPVEPKFLLLAYNQATNKFCGHVLVASQSKHARGFTCSHGYLSDNKITIYLPVNSEKGHKLPS